MSGKPVFGVNAKSVINFDSKFREKLLCDGPTFSASASCTASCAYCYVPQMMKKAEPWLAKQGVIGKHEDIVIRRNDAINIARKQLLSHSKSERQKKKVIYSSPLADVAMNSDLVRETVEICKVILELTNWDIRLLSKSNLLPKVAMLLEEIETPHNGRAEGRVIYGVSTGTLDDKLAAAFEEGTPKVSKRIESLHWLQDNGFRTFGMICPSLPAVEPSGYGKFAREMYDAIRGDKCEHVWNEVINVRGESFTRTEKCLRDAGFDQHASVLKLVSENKDAWEAYARRTFESHSQFYKRGQFRFLQYVTKSTRPYWESQISNGAVLL